jgi:hypothetical protein
MQIITGKATVHQENDKTVHVGKEDARTILSLIRLLGEKASVSRNVLEKL